MQGEVELFARAREFLAGGSRALNGRVYARNVRVADVVAYVQLPNTTPPNVYWAAYQGGAADNGPLDDNGNMPMSSAGIIIGSGALYDTIAGVDDGADMWSTNDAYRQLSAKASHVARVAGTDVITRALAYSLQIPSQGIDQPATSGPAAVGRPSTKERQPEPLLFVGPGERLQQGVKVRETLNILPSDADILLVATMVIADEGTD